MENPRTKGMIGGYPHDLGNLHMLNKSFQDGRGMI